MTTNSSRRARAIFFLRIGRLRRASESRCVHTMPLFPLALILEADGTLAAEAKRVVGRSASK